MNEPEKSGASMPVNEGSCQHLLAQAQEHIEQLNKLLEIDQITGLPVRRALERVLCPKIDAGEAVALAIIRLDDRYRQRPMSSSFVAALLFSVGKRLSEMAPGQVFQSWRTDEYVMFLQEPTVLSDLEGFAESIRETVERPVLDGPFHIRLGCNVGFALFPEHGSTVEELLTNAEIALGIVEQREARATVYQHEMGLRRRRQFEIEQAIGEAIQTGLSDFSLAFQPIVDRSGRLHGVEALMRWETSSLGVVPPGEFIPIAEQYGHIQLLGLWAIYHVATIASGWRSTEYGEPIVTVNVSAMQLREPDFAVRAVELIRIAGADPRRFRFELTESVIVADPESATRTLEVLKAEGVMLMIDDFGTGFSSFSYLHKLPIDTIKIAREFVEGVAGSESSRAVVRSIISVSHEIGGSVLAEGVETREQFDVLLSEGCDFFQGYYFGRPRITERLEGLLDGSV
ncbi:MAG: putative bifunctional diguanylate cyclase/phosphodiesterase [Spirochaetaceae bacterium]